MPDPSGTTTSLSDGGIGAAHPWERSPVPAPYQIRGLGPITISVPDIKPTGTDGALIDADTTHVRKTDGERHR